MLKLEKTSFASSLTVRLREKETFFESRLLMALAIALSLHLAAAYLFTVIPFYISSSFTFPPAKVQVDIPSEVSVTASLHSDHRSELIPPPISLVPFLETPLIHRESILAPTFSLDPLALQFIEERFWPTWQSPLSFRLEEPKMQLFISGDLAKYRWNSHHPIFSQKQSLNASSSPAYVVYDVQLDEKSGKLFSYERKQSSGDQMIDQLTEKVLLELQFEPVNTLESIKGTLNFVFAESI